MEELVIDVVLSIRNSVEWAKSVLTWPNLHMWLQCDTWVVYNSFNFLNPVSHSHFDQPYFTWFHFTSDPDVIHNRNMGLILSSASWNSVESICVSYNILRPKPKKRSSTLIIGDICWVSFHPNHCLDFTWSIFCSSRWRTYLNKNSFQKSTLLKKDDLKVVIILSSFS